MFILEVLIEILIRIDAIITVSLFAMLSVISLAAAALLYARPIQTTTKESLSEQYSGAILLSLGALSFMVGIPLTLLFDSVLDLWHDNLWIELLDVAVTITPFILGFLFLYAGIANLVRYLIFQEDRMIPSWLFTPFAKLFTRVVDYVLRPKKDEEDNSISELAARKRRPKSRL